MGQDRVRATNAALQEQLCNLSATPDDINSRVSVSVASRVSGAAHDGISKSVHDSRPLSLNRLKPGLGVALSNNQQGHRFTPLWVGRSSSPHRQELHRCRTTLHLCSTEQVPHHPIWMANMAAALHPINWVGMYHMIREWQPFAPTM